MSVFIRLLFVASALLLAACSHTIQISPAPEAFDGTSVASKSTHNVGYYISPENRLVKVTTPGGGGDKVTYQPYRDTEATLHLALSKLFTKVYSMPAADDKAFLAEKNISYVIVPKIVTNSSSSSAITWPPTSFTMSLTCIALDAEGKEIWQDSVTGEGKAEFDEFKKDFSLSARRASEEAFKKLMHKIAASELVQ